MPRTDQLYRAVLETAVDAIITIDARGVVLACNPATERIFGYPPDELIGQNVSLLMPMPHRAAHDGYIERYLETGEAKIIGVGREVQGRHRDGRVVPLFLGVSAVRVDEGVLFTGILREIGELKSYERRLEELNRSLEARNAELQGIVYIASHDLRAPLVNIQGFSTELQHSCEALGRTLEQVPMPPEAGAELEKILGEDIPESLRFILNGAAKMDALLKGLLRLSRLGRAALNVQALDMTRLVSEAARALDYQLAEAGGVIALGELPPCHADESQVTQVFVNLIDNAIKYRSPDRPLRIDISGESAEGRSRYLVRDNGVGVKDAHRAKVFEIFHRLEDVRVEGEGLGLTIAQRILHRLDGLIEIAEGGGPGTTFVVDLPAVAPSEERRG